MKPKYGIGALVMAGILLFATGAYAEGRYKMIEVFFERIQVKVNGQPLQLSQDSLLYDGSVYVPLRNLSETLGAKVDWDDTARTVNLDFIQDSRYAFEQAALRSMYQYMALQNNLIMSDLIAKVKAEDWDGMKGDVERLDGLRQTALTMKQQQAADLLDKLTMAVELMRSGLSSRQTSDYSLAWDMFNTNEKQLIDLLQKQTSQP